MDWLFAVAGASWTMLVLAAPYVLFGLVAAGLMHVLLPESLVLRWMGGPGLLGVVRAALIGVPLPVCSCGVVPIAVELRRKGASRPASQSFLITTPESSIDSIFLTWGMMGPVMAIARPIAAFFTAVLGGILSIASARSVNELTVGDLRSAGDPSDEPASRPSRPACEGHDHADHDHSQHDHGHHHHHHHGHDHDHDHDHGLTFAGGARARQALRNALARRPPRTPDADGGGLTKAVEVDGSESAAEAAEEPSLWRDLTRPALRYGFGQLLDDLAFWLVVGIVLAGVLTASLPDNLDQLGFGTGLLPMIALLIVGIPLYMCASASTPIAAALMLKGVSPGAALVFLLAGPATNAATVLLLGATFGRRFVRTYVISVAVGALAAGLLLDFVLGDVDLTDALRVSEESGPGAFMVLSGLLLSWLLARSLWRGAWAAGVDELRQAGRRVHAQLPESRLLRRRNLVAMGLLLVTLVYLGTGLHAVPAGSRGYEFRFGALVAEDLVPGLHYVPPAPIGRLEVRHVGYPRKTDVGFKTDLFMVEHRRELVRRASTDEWHSPVAAMNTIPSKASYLTGDGNLVEMSFSVHYTLGDPGTFFYGVDHGRDFVNLYAEAAARELVARLSLEELLTDRRVEAETLILGALQDDLDEQGLGIDLLTIRIVDLHPPGSAVRAFREVSSAKEDRETAIHHAFEDQAQRIPRSRGRAALRVAEAEAEAARRRKVASSESRTFSASAELFGEHRAVLGHLLWIESLERVLAGREKLIVPPESGPDDFRGITLWPRTGPPFPPVSPLRETP
ncbi:MAG: SO_0444 family Cu/Zn efflux transporter [Acidobacteriota bacterium]